MDFKTLKIYRAKEAARKVERAISDLARVDRMQFDGKRVFLRCIPFGSVNDSLIEQRIYDLKFDPVAFRESGYLQIYFPLNKRRTERPAWVVNVVLFLITIGTTFVTGMFLGSGNDSIWVSGFLFSGSLLLILGSHEFGHYFLSLYHKMKATLPYFIPAPPFPFTPIGTFGAFIKMKSRIPDRIALFDVGVAGPLAGFAVAVPLTIWGLGMSEIVSISPAGSGNFILGDSILFKAMGILFAPPMPQGTDILLHPVAYAGWIGFLITAMNLLPIGQLDGGHIIYAMYPRQHRKIARLFFFILILIGFYYYHGWIVWGLLILFLVRIDHPPTQDDYKYLDTPRIMLGYLSILIFILTFTPVPIMVS